MSPDEEFGISLGIERVVTDRRRNGSRVIYRDTPTHNWVIPERIVLHRWRRKERTPQGVQFKGCRLPPGTWRAVLRYLPGDLNLDSVTPHSLGQALDAVRAKNDEEPPLGTPDLESLFTLLQFLKRRRVLEKVLTRHRDQVKASSPGIPDLFLYRIEPDGTVSRARFVEVKKPEEVVSHSQVEELQFLRGLDLKAGIVRLIETPSESAGVLHFRDP